MMPVEFPFVLMKHAFFLDKYFLFVSIFVTSYLWFEYLEGNRVAAEMSSRECQNEASLYVKICPQM